MNIEQILKNTKGNIRRYEVVKASDCGTFNVGDIIHVDHSNNITNYTTEVFVPPECHCQTSGMEIQISDKILNTEIYLRKQAIKNLQSGLDELKTLLDTQVENREWK